ncbi:YqgE/AlgH family protein [Spartinivicinus ruber]|uniref:YqgE/AlgH family protein n=1 Tax=Spartinivicinus ruber TaxID=2683272 RepID=UPI0013D2D17E|nr:YqgE/AlgH family protein [Spartinivicinus ruber]
MKTQVPDSLRNRFLIAMPHLMDPNFSQSVTFICEHNEQGAMGIVINRPTQLTLGEIFRQVGIEPNSNNRYQSELIYAGGPVELERGFVLHTPGEHKWDSSISVSPNIQLTTSKDILQAMAKNEGPENALVALGYAGWEAGQLEREIKDNAWLTCDADPLILFQTPMDKRLEAAAALIGVDLHLLSTEVGHA